MNYQCVSARFYFFNGNKGYTVEYAYGITSWYIFEEDKRTDALWWKKINPAKSKTPNRGIAEDILNEYLDLYVIYKK